jgi:hypothetical protein
MGTPRIARFVVWICSKFNKTEIEGIISGLSEVLKNPDSEVYPRDKFKEDHPNYRNYDADVDAPLDSPPKPKKKRRTTRKS